MCVSGLGPRTAISNDDQVYRFDPKIQTCTLESWRTNKLLMKRYHTVLRAKDADVFGILVGTLGVGMLTCLYILFHSLKCAIASYLPLISHLRALLKKAHKKSYTVSVGKLNPAKLANFAEIECFVLVACPENSVVESKVRLIASDIHTLTHPLGILSADRYSI